MKENERIPSVWINKISQSSWAYNFDIQFDDRMAWISIRDSRQALLVCLVSCQLRAIFL